jgi:inosine-uridine nucleoside N-ribohydrolase
MVKHVILDTDIGGDPDDAFALLLGMNSPEINIDMIVTSDEHRGHRAEFARKFLERSKVDIPVVKGNDLGNSKCCVVCDLVKDETSSPVYLPKIREIVQNNPKTYYVCISPQTNLASFLDYAPDLIPKLEVVIMGGAINYRKKDRAEHNMKYDVNAARKVFGSNADMRWVLSDTTFNPNLEIDEEHPIYKRLRDSDFSAKESLLKNCQNFFGRLHPSTIMHDPLTLSYVIRPEFLTFEEKRLDIDKYGKVHLSEEGRPIKVSTNAEYKKFMNFFSQRLPF